MPMARVNAQIVDFSISQHYDGRVGIGGPQGAKVFGDDDFQKETLTRIDRSIFIDLLGEFPPGVYDRRARAVAGVTVRTGKVQAFSRANANQLPWDPSEVGAYWQDLSAGSFLNGKYTETLSASAAGRTGETAILEMRFYAPLQQDFARGAAEAESAAIARLNPGTNWIEYTLAGRTAEVTFESDVFAAGWTGPQEDDPGAGYDPWMTLRAPVTLGSFFAASIGVQLQSYAFTSGDSPAFAEAGLEFGHGISFAGARLFDVNGNEIRNFTLRNDHGIDFRQSFAPVPEPATYALAAMLLLLGQVGWRAKRRRSLARCAA